MKFKIGDRILVKKQDIDGVWFENETGTIKCIGHHEGLLVEFDEPFEEGHNGDNISENGNCWWVQQYHIDPLFSLGSNKNIKQKIEILCEHLYT